jgi:hypothetical protein
LDVVRIARGSFKADPNAGLPWKKPNNRSDAPLWGDGCGTADNDYVVPDLLKVKGAKGPFSIFKSCQAHDRCYEGKLGSGYENHTQDKCDSMLRDKIMTECIDAGGRWKDCNTVSGIYYDALHALGKKGYSDARRKNK